MRKYLKKMIDDLFQLLEQTHEEIKKEIENKNIPEALHLLEQSQQGAIQAGTVIENAEGEGFSTVGLIEQYCEMLYQIYETLSQNQTLNPGRACKNLRKQLIRIQNSANADVPIRTEVVFLPYKASMWDSLESVWRAASADPDCDAYVIPIPYYDKNPDGSFREMHYEGNDYPLDVPVMDYRAYDFEKRHPDMIFIHNPYDEANYVTSVPPHFFAKNLKAYTDLLVYIPYFILGEISQENDTAIEGMKHFCLQPGVIHADKVIVQSEDMRQVYIKVLTEELGEESRNYWEQKILGIGSPKVDKVLETKQDQAEIPEEWKTIIEKPDGSRKKIIFYNTGVSALLKHEEKLLIKMQDVFRIFKESRDDVALLWRPHPLIKATIESMRPELWAEYKKLVDEYRNEGWGIYDDTPDMDRAVALADAYYGDGSSIVQLFKQVGKPVMVQDVDAEYHQKLFFYDCIWEDGEIIFPLTNYNVLCKANILTGETICIGQADEDADFFLYAGIYKLKKYLMMSAKNARPALAFYGLETDQWFHIPVENDKKIWLNFREEDVFEQNNYIYVFSYSLVILKVDVRKEKVFYIYYPDTEPDSDIRGDIVRVDKKVYVPVKHCNKIYKFDLETELIETITVNTKLRGIDTLCFDGNLFWMTGIGRMICSWDEKNNISLPYDNFPEKFKKFTERKNEEGWWFKHSIVNKNYVYFIPGYANMLIKWDIYTKKMSEIHIEDEEENEESFNRSGRYHVLKYGVSKLKENMLMLLSAKNKNLILIDLNTGMIKKTELRMQHNTEKVISGLLESDLSEKKMNIQQWIEIICNPVEAVKKINRKEELAGQKIIEFLK